MGRWEPDAAGRLRAAAMELYVERGYDQTTVADIAARAGVTARTFFRHFADKREVLFAGSAELQERMLEALATAPPGTAPLEAVAAALAVSARMLGDHREYSRRRQEVIAAHDDLRERELVKLDAIGAALAAGLRDRGVPEPEASLTADTGIVVFRQGFARWAFAAEDRPLLEVMTELFQQLRAITA
ncbi:helix-turn-helix domain-containing protein [Jatrophihabitans sp. YIM 134969]